MNTLDQLLSYGLPPDKDRLPEIRRVLGVEIEHERSGLSREEDVAFLCCAQLFSRALPEDVLLIWAAKSSGMDLGVMIDVQMLCGSGLATSKQFLSDQSSDESLAALAYIEQCERTGDFKYWTPESQLEYYRGYFGLS